MNPETEKEATTLAKEYKKLEILKNIELGLALPFPYFAPVKKALSRNSIQLGLQNIHAEKSGPFTGEVSFSMMANQKPLFTLIGHSERRAAGETNAMINQKILTALKNKITPIICVGETVRDDHGAFHRIVADQITAALVNVPKAAISRIVIAYEPVWAISSHATREATPEECREMIIYIKKTLADLSGISAKDMPRIMYGGSVNELNAHEYIDAGADGLLPGHLSLEPKKMQKLIYSLQVIPKK